MELVKTIEFETEAERSSYLMQRFGPPRRLISPPNKGRDG